jgi:hypothetical protein
VTAAVTKPNIPGNPEGDDGTDVAAITDEQLLALTVAQRRRLAHRLALLSASAPLPPGRRRFVTAIALGCAGLAAWMLAQAAMLPSRYLVGHWDTAWIGFDFMLLFSLAAVGWTAWRRIEAFPVAALVTAVLLVCDAWFDVMTASGGTDTAASVISAVVVELPLAAGLAYLAFRRCGRG